MSTKNDVTGDSIQSRSLSEEGRENWQKIFGKGNELDFEFLNKLLPRSNQNDSCLTEEYVMKYFPISQCF